MCMFVLGISQFLGDIEGFLGVSTCQLDRARRDLPEAISCFLGNRHGKHRIRLYNMSYV